MMKKLLVGAAAVAILSSGAFAATINSAPGMYAIGTLGGEGGTQSSLSYGISVDNGIVYTAGESWSPTWGASHPFIGKLDSSVSQIIEIPNPSGAASKAQGVSVAPTAGQIAAGGTVGGIGRYYIAPLSDIAGGSWSVLYGSSSAVEGFNVNRTDTATDRTEVVGRNTANNRGLRVRMTVGSWTSSVGEYLPGYGNYVTAKSISQGRVMVGEEKNTPRSRDSVYNAGINVANTRIPQARDERSEGFGISEDGSYMSGLLYNAAASWAFDAFIWDTADATSTVLPVSTYWEVNPVAYAVNNDGMAVGRVYTDVDGEVAAIWMDKTTQAQTLAELAAANGISLSGWDKLTRAYGVSNVGDDGKYAITGYGTWAADGTSRAFVMVVPEPATLSFLALGGLALLRRRR